MRTSSASACRARLRRDREGRGADVGNVLSEVEGLTTNGLNQSFLNGQETSATARGYIPSRNVCIILPCLCAIRRAPVFRRQTIIGVYGNPLHRVARMKRSGIRETRQNPGFRPCGPASGLQQASIYYVMLNNNSSGLSTDRPFRSASAKSPD